MEEINFKNYGVDQQRLQIPELHFDKFPTPQTFSCWKIRLKTEVCSFFQISLQKRCYGSMKWRCLIRWRIQNLGALSRESLLFLKIVGREECISPEQVQEFLLQEKKVSLEEQQAQQADRFLRGRHIAYLIYDYFLVTGINDSVLDYADSFTTC